MKLTGLESNEVILKEIGRRIRDIRVAFPITQKELAEQSGVSVMTVVHLENGREVNTGSLIRIMRVLRLLGSLELMIPEQEAHPADLLQLGKKRERAPGPGKGKRKKIAGFIWGEDAGRKQNSSEKRN